MFVSFGKDDVGGRNAPVDGERRVVPGVAAFGRRAVEVVARVLEHDFLGQDDEPMGEPPRDEHHPVVLPGQFLGMPAAVGG